MKIQFYGSFVCVKVEYIRVIFNERFLSAQGFIKWNAFRLIGMLLLD